MQSLVAGPRAGADPRAVYALLHADDMRTAAYGADLLDRNDQKVDELPAALLREPMVSWDGEADIHRSADFIVGRELQWDRDRVRLWRDLRSASLGLTFRFHRGVFIPTSPARGTDGSRNPQFQVKAWDKLRLLRSAIGDTWATLWNPTGQTTYLGPEVRRILGASGWTGKFVLPVQAEPGRPDSILLREPMVWPLADGETQYLRVLIDLLRAGGCTEPYVDEEGTGRADLITPVAQRPLEWTLDFGDKRWTLVDRERSVTGDVGEVPNQWRYVNTSLDREPVIDDGLYDPPDNESLGPSSINSRDFRLKVVRKVDAVDQAALVRLGDEGRAADIRGSRTRQFSTAPLPLMGHRDLLQLLDPVLGNTPALVSKWGPEDLSGQNPRTPVTAAEAIA